MFIKFCYERVFDVEESKKKIDDIYACLYKVYDEYADAARMQFFGGSSALTSDIGGQGDTSLVSSINLSKRKLDIDFAQFRSQIYLKCPKRSEVDCYLDDDILPDPANKEFDILA